MLEERKTIGSLLAGTAARQPAAPAFYFEDTVATYDDLLSRARTLAAAFAGLGLRPGDRTALLLPNVPEFVYAWFGAALAGLVTVPINPAYKADEIRYILADASASGLLTIPSRCADIESIRADLPALEHVWVTGPTSGAFTGLDDLARGGPAGPGFRDVPSPDDPASIIYTSGTTGRPKGVVLTHRNYQFDTWSLTTHLGATARDRFLCFLPLYHVNAQVVSVLSAVYVGGALILLREFKPSTFFEQVARYEATTFSAVPTIYAILNTLPDASRYDLSSLRYCVCGAAPMPVEVFQTFEAKFGARIVEGYGLSEATCGNCVNPLGGDRPRKIGSIGVPLPGQTMAILDDGGNELPDGAIGEIAVRGEVVMREYFRNEEATAEALRGGWLHTGDLGHRDADGFYFIDGRKKEMIIRGGANVYPKEIEEILYRHPAVQEAAVIGLPDPIWGETVCACIVAKPGASLTESEVVDLCRLHLADYKVPARAVFMEAFPKTPTGKIQKNRIRV